MDALREAEAKLTVYVHPSNAADVRRAVARQLSSLLFSYEDRFDGVLLAHEATVESEQGKILNGLVPYFGVPVHANLLLYSPKPDMMLEGKVEMLGKESIHAIVLGVFSAAIMLDDIHEKFKFKRKKYGGKFVSRSDKQHVIKKGSMIRFSVKRYGLIFSPLDSFKIFIHCLLSTVKHLYSKVMALVCYYICNLLVVCSTCCTLFTNMHCSSMLELFFPWCAYYDRSPEKSHFDTMALKSNKKTM
ncbi:uncharacterized protein LOC127775809 isoform X1 [Oryza glaberrima]|uniref:DNA-directed RNA polymerase subunit n=1 Tax=Oryza glaberrima TaxID=4538 RepID=I1PZW1_ORYGL|nr:uncharacterized protein LOC127775809 isoform X1 [Oryza glaberrima]